MPLRPCLCLPLSLLLISSGWSDDTQKIAALFEPVAEAGGLVTIPPGDYHLDGTNPVPLTSNTTVSAYGARFHFPESPGEKARLILFSGEDISNLTWMGGEFLGNVFDPASERNHWEPNANTKGIEITTSEAGETRDLLFRDIKSNGVAGAVIGVHGLAGKRSDSEVTRYAERIVLENCTLLRSGKFMWDYGYLWQIMTWPGEYSSREVEQARKYFRTDLIRGNLDMDSGDDKIRFNNRTDPIPVTKTDDPKETLTFLSGVLPENIIRGHQYFVVESSEDFIKISEALNGPPIRFQGSGGPDASLVYNLSASYLSAYAPTGSGPGKGAFDIVGVKDVRVTGCQLSALGDTMHIQRCHNVIFANNHIIGSRMGAFFLAEYCKNATITGNLVDGSNGSRVVSVERSCTDVTMTGNTFRNGGRGVWINQPVNFIMTGNIFVDNNTKNEPDKRRGRIAYQTGQAVKFPALYVTLYDPAATYGPAIIRDNLFILADSTPEEAVTFAPNGHDLNFSGNIFQNKAAKVVVDPTCRVVSMDQNPGSETVVKPVVYDHGRR